MVIVRLFLGIVSVAAILYFLWNFAVNMTAQQVRIAAKAVIFLSVSSFLFFLFVQLF